MGSYCYVPIAALRFSTKKRRGVCHRRVSELQWQLESDFDMTPIRINALGDGTYTVKDGRHRIQAHIEAGIDHIYAYVENLITKLGRLFNFQPALRWLFLLPQTIF